MAANWTVMVLMGANNLPNEKDLTSFAEDDLKEMEAVGSKDGVLNIVVQIDRKAKAGGPQRYFIKNEKEGGRKKVGKIPDGQGSSGDPHVLEYFMTWAKDAYPAKHYLLVVWGHAYKFAFDRDGLDALDFTKLSGVLERTNKGKKLDIVAFDSCNMMWFEGAYELRDRADYLVASQFSDPLPGWPYKAILYKPLFDAPGPNGPGIGPRDFGRAIVNLFVNHYVGTASVTLTMLDLSQADEVFDCVRVLANELVPAVQQNPDELDRVAAIFHGSHVADGQPGVDLATLCWHLANYSGDADLRKAATRLGDLLFRPKDPFVLAHERSDLNVALLKGVSIFAPNVESENGFDWRSVRPVYEKLDFAKETIWGDLVFAMAESDY